MQDQAFQDASLKGDDVSKLWNRLERLAEIGALGNGGVNRQAYSEGERNAIRLIVGWARAIGCRILHDPAGNLFIRLDPQAEAAAQLPPVVSGSHIDSQPNAGKYDGAYGVLAALCALEAISVSGLELTRPIEVAIWMNEEGCRFAPGTMGSALHTGSLVLDDIVANQDGSGITLGEELACHLRVFEELEIEACPFQRPMSAYIEAHIEQGPVLEALDKSLAPVLGIQGARWFTVDVRGRAAHAGTTPRSLRADALSAAIELVTSLTELCSDSGDMLRFTIGRFEVAPGSVNTVPDHVRFTIDLRHGDVSVLDEIEAGIRDIVAGPIGNCAVSMTRDMHLTATQFNEDLVARIARAAMTVAGTGPAMLSGAFHDAVNLAQRCPTAMLFIACKAGLSHHPDENITVEDANRGAEVLQAVLRELACCGTHPQDGQIPASRWPHE